MYGFKHTFLKCRASKFSLRRRFLLAVWWTRQLTFRRHQALFWDGASEQTPVNIEWLWSKSLQLWCVRRACWKLCMLTSVLLVPAFPVLSYSGGSVTDQIAQFWRESRRQYSPLITHTGIFPNMPSATNVQEPLRTVLEGEFTHLWHNDLKMAADTILIRLKLQQCSSDQHLIRRTIK